MCNLQYTVWLLTEPALKAEEKKRSSIEKHLENVLTESFTDEKQRKHNNKRLVCPTI